MKCVPPLILVVEDDKDIRRVTCAVLSANSYRVIEADTGQKALEAIGAQHPDVMLLDLGLPDMSGLDVIRRLPDTRRPSIVVFSAGGLHRDKIAALQAGAVDYLAKPFLNVVLLKRLRSALRISKSNEIESTSHFSLGDIDVDLQIGRVLIREREVNLTSGEFRLLTTFVRNCGRLLTYRFLIDHVFAPNESPIQFELLTLVSQLRHKIESDPLRPRYLLAEPGIGYRLLDDC